MLFSKGGSSSLPAPGQARRVAALPRVGPHGTCYRPSFRDAPRTPENCSTPSLLQLGSRSGSGCQEKEIGLGTPATPREALERECHLRRRPLVLGHRARRSFPAFT